MIASSRSDSTTQASDLRLARARLAGEQRRAIEDDRRPAAGLLMLGVDVAHLRDQVQQKEQRPVGHRRQPGTEASLEAHLCVLLADLALAGLPLDAERWIRQAVVKRAARVRVLGERVAQDDRIHRLPLDHHVGLAHRIRAGVHLLAGHLQARGGVLLAQVLVHRRQHAAGAGRGVVDGADDVRLAGRVLVADQQQVHHQGDDLPRGEVLASGLVGGLGELADQLLKDGAHLGVAHLRRAEVDRREALQHEVEGVRLVEALDLVLEAEAGEDVADVVAEPVDVGQQVGLDVGAVAGERGQRVLRGVVEGVAGALAQPDVEQVPVRVVPSGNPFGVDDVLSRREHAVEATQDGHR